MRVSELDLATDNENSCLQCCQVRYCFQYYCDERLCKMSFIDLATLALHRRNEMEVRINSFALKCDQAMEDITKLKQKAQDFVNHLNCDPIELKERFLNCMRTLDEYTYLITDFNLNVRKLEESTGSIDYTPVHDTSAKSILTPQPAFNIMDVLSEPTPSTSSACPNKCPLLHKKSKARRISKEEQTLILFSSASGSSESIPVEKKAGKTEKDLVNGMNKISVKESPPQQLPLLNLPAQTVLEMEHEYPATIMNVDGASLWLITDDIDEAYELMNDMTSYYKSNHVTMTLEEITCLTYCAFYDDEGDCFYRGLFIRLTEEDMTVAEVFLVDTGEMRSAPAVAAVQPLAPRFFQSPPFARCMHLAGVDLLCYNDTGVLEQQEEFLKQYIGTQCVIEVDDNTSESLGVYIKLSENVTLNDLMIREGLALSTEQPTRAMVKPQDAPIQKAKSSRKRLISSNRAHSAASSVHSAGHTYGPPEMKERTRSDSENEITACPEYEDPVEAVMGYSCRDEADICKHYKGGPEQTCFKGSRCTKRHVMKRPDGWTLDRIEVVGKCPPAELPAPGTWHRGLVTYVCHFDRLYVQFIDENQPENNPLPEFGVVLPPTTLEALVRDMNSAAAKIAYKPLKIMPAPGEIVAALYPPDDQWYRARVQTITRSEQTVEVMYIDYGNVVWVKEDAIRQVEPRWTQLPAQAVRCVLAGVKANSHDSRRWAEAKTQLRDMTQGRTLEIHVISQDYDEITVEMYDEEGYNIAEQLAALKLVDFNQYALVEDTDTTLKVVVP